VEAFRMPTQPRIRGLVADDNAAVRQAIATVLQASDDLELATASVSPAEAVRQCSETPPDVVLLDMALPDMSSAAVTRGIHALCPAIRVVALSSFQDESLVQGVLPAGAVGYMLKNVSADELAGIIRTAHRAPCATALQQADVPVPASIISSNVGTGGPFPTDSIQPTASQKGE